jgi:hypothetical protein
MQGEILALKSFEGKNMSMVDSTFESDSDTESEQEITIDTESNIAGIPDDKSQIPDNKSQIPDDKLVYYEIKDGSVYLTHFGLHVYIDMGPKYLANMYEYFKIRKFYNDITSGLINAIKDIRRIKENQYANQIYGL